MTFVYFWASASYVNPDKGNGEEGRINWVCSWNAEWLQRMKHHSQLFNYILFDYLIPSSMLWIRMVSSSPIRAYMFRCLDTYMFRCLDFPIQIMAVYFLTLNNFDIIYLMITFSWFIGKPQTLSYPLIKFLLNSFKNYNLKNLKT